MATETKHAALAATIRRRIEAGDYTDELPSESDLMREFDLSRSTVRQAFATLVNEGLISARSGTRRRVAKRQRLQWPMTTWEKAHTADADAWAVSVRDQGCEPSTSTAVHIERASADVAAALDLDEGAPVVVRRRIRSVDGEPHQLSDSYFPQWLADAHPVFLEPGDLSASGGLLASVGLPQARYLDEITARMPTPDEARLLGVGSGVPLLLHTRTGYDKSERPVRHMITRMAADRVDVRYELDL